MGVFPREGSSRGLPVSSPSRLAEHVQDPQLLGGDDPSGLQSPRESGPAPRPPLKCRVCRRRLINNRCRLLSVTAPPPHHWLLLLLRGMAWRGMADPQLPAGPGGALSEAEAKRGYLHGVQVDDCVVGGSRAQWVHQGQGGGLHGRQLQALEEAAEGQLGGKRRGVNGGGGSGPDRECQGTPPAPGESGRIAPATHPSLPRCHASQWAVSSPAGHAHSKSGSERVGPHTYRALGGGAVEAQVPGLQAAVKALAVQDQRRLHGGQGILL